MDVLLDWYQNHLTCWISVRYFAVLSAILYVFYAFYAQPIVASCASQVRRRSAAVCLYTKNELPKFFLFRALESNTLAALLIP